MIPQLLNRLLPAVVFLSLAAPRAVNALSIYDVIMLSRSGYESAEIVNIISTTGTAFRLTAGDAVYLKSVGVSDPVIEAMLAAVPAEAQETGVERADYATPAVTMEDLLLLAASRVSDEIILAFIETREIGFTPGAAEIVRLREAGLSEDVIRQLLTRTAAAREIGADYAPARTAFYPTQQYYYGPSYFIGFGGTRHRLFDHHHVFVHPITVHRVFLHPGTFVGPRAFDPGTGHHFGLHHDKTGHHFGLHHGTDHHVGLHGQGDRQHIGLHHITPRHVELFHTAPPRTAADQSPSAGVGIRSVAGTRSGQPPAASPGGRITGSPAIGLQNVKSSTPVAGSGTVRTRVQTPAGSANPGISVPTGQRRTESRSFRGEAHDSVRTGIRMRPR